MGRTLTSSALVLKTYDIGDADRLCILLTEQSGRLAALSKGVRKPKSRWSGALQSFQHLQVDLSEHSSGWYLRSAECISSFDGLRRDMEKFRVASEGCELLLRFLHDTEDGAEPIFHLTRDFLQALNRSPSPLLLPTFRLSLLTALGSLPSFTEYSRANISPSLRSWLSSQASFTGKIACTLSASDMTQLHRLSETFVRDHLSFPLKSVSCFARSRGSSGGTPISSILERAS